MKPEKNKTEHKKVLIIRLTSLGDVIFTLPLVNALKTSGYEIGFLTAEKGINVIDKNPCIGKVHYCRLAKWRKNRLSFNTFKEFWGLIKELRAEKYDIAIDCQQMFKSLYLFLLCGAKRRITFSNAKELSFLGGNEFIKETHKFKDNNYHIVKRNLEFAKHLGIDYNEPKFSLPKINEKTKIKVDNLLTRVDKPIAVLAPATTWVNKHWAEKNWTELIKIIIKENNYQAVITGGKNDCELINKILAPLNDNEKSEIINICGKTDLTELQEVLTRAEKLITVDSGTAHLGWACSNPDIISIFTCTPPLRFAPFGSEKYKYLTGDLDCHYCFTKKCKLHKNRLICKQYPTPKEVITVLNNSITSNKPQ